MPTCRQGRPLRARTARRPALANGARAKAGEKTIAARGATTTGSTGGRTGTSQTAGEKTMADHGIATVSGRLTGSDIIETTGKETGRGTSSTIATGTGGVHAHPGEIGAAGRICGGTGDDRGRVR